MLWALDYLWQTLVLNIHLNPSTQAFCTLKNGMRLTWWPGIKLATSCFARENVATAEPLWHVRGDQLVKALDMPSIVFFFLHVCCVFFLYICNQETYSAFTHWKSISYFLNGLCEVRHYSSWKSLVFVHQGFTMYLTIFVGWLKYLQPDKVSPRRPFHETLFCQYSNHCDN